MTTRKAIQSALAKVTKTKLPTTTTRASISSMVRLESSTELTSLRHRPELSGERDLGRAEVYRTSMGHPLQDYVSRSDASNFIVSWPAHDNQGDSLTSRMLNTLEGIRQSTSIQVTPPFHILDGSGDKVASMCIVPSQNSAQDRDSSMTLDNWRSPGHWMDYYVALNQ